MDVWSLSGKELKVFASADAAQTWFDENDPEGCRIHVQAGRRRGIVGLLRMNEGGLVEYANRTNGSARFHANKLTSHLQLNSWTALQKCERSPVRGSSLGGALSATCS
jgi:hypothetical protein